MKWEQEMRGATWPCKRCAELSGHVKDGAELPGHAKDVRSYLAIEKMCVATWPWNRWAELPGDAKDGGGATWPCRSCAELPGQAKDARSYLAMQELSGNACRSSLAMQKICVQELPARKRRACRSYLAMQKMCGAIWLCRSYLVLRAGYLAMQMTCVQELPARKRRACRSYLAMQKMCVAGATWPCKRCAELPGHAGATWPCVQELPGHAKDVRAMEKMCGATWPCKRCAELRGHAKNAKTIAKAAEKECGTECM